MEESEDFIEGDRAEYDDHAHQACYVFNSVEQDELSAVQPAKRRKLDGTKSKSDSIFPKLLNGEEHESHVRLRYDLFKRNWTAKEAKINEALNDVDQDIVTQFKAFVDGSGATSNIEKLPTGIFLSGSDNNAHQRLLSAWKDQLDDPEAQILVQLQPGHCPNLQTFLKNVIKLAITASTGIDAYHDHLNKHKRLIPMSFDLELLQEFTQENKLSKIVVSILDGEIFDTGILMEMLSTLHSWMDRIPFVLVIGLATTVELFESRLANFSVKQLDAQIFDLSSSSTDPLYRVLEICHTDEDNICFLGPSVISSLSEMTQAQGATIEKFTRALKYTYMSHFFSNPLSILASPDFDSTATKHLHPLCEAIRNTDTFHSLCDTLLDACSTGGIYDDEAAKLRANIRELLNSDKRVLDEVLQSIKEAQPNYRRMSNTIAAHTDLLHSVQPYRYGDYTCLQPSQSHIDTLAMMYRIFTERQEFRHYYDEIFPSVCRLHSKDLLIFLESLTEKTITTLDLSNTLSELRDFQAKLPVSRPSIRSRDDLDPPGIEMSFALVRDKALHPLQTNPIPIPVPTPPDESLKLDTLEKEYASIQSTLQAKLDASLYHCPPFHDDADDDSDDFTTGAFKNILTEAYIFDLRQPLHASLVFPKPRHAIERALSRPADYLSCTHEPCGGDSNDVVLGHEVSSPHPPPTSILYTLLQEAPIVINVRDLFDAFCTRIRDDSSTTTKPSTSATSTTTSKRPKRKRKDEVEEEEVEEEQDTTENTKSKDAQTEAEIDTEKEMDRLIMTLFYRSLAELKYLGLVKPSASTGVKKKALLKQQRSQSSSGAMEMNGMGDVDFIAKTSWFGL